MSTKRRGLRCLCDCDISIYVNFMFYQSQYLKLGNKEKIYSVSFYDAVLRSTWNVINRNSISNLLWSLLACVTATKSTDTFHLLRRFPQLITKATHVDCYKPWSFHTYQYVAKKWLMSPQTAEKVHYRLTHKMRSVSTNCIKYILYGHRIQSYPVL